MLSELIGQLTDTQWLITITGVYTVATGILAFIAFLQWRSQQALASLQRDMLTSQNALVGLQERTAQALERAAIAQRAAADANETSNKLQVLLKLFDILSTPELSNARGAVFKEYCKVYGKDRTITDDKNRALLQAYDKIKGDVRKVESAFDQAGLIILEEKVGQNLFLKVYALMVIRTYTAVRVHIDEFRGPGGTRNPAFALWYTELYEKSIEYYRDVLKREPEPIYCDE